MGGIVDDIDVDRDSGEIVAVGDFGITVLDSKTENIVWSQTGNFDRVAIANDSTVATLTESTDTVTLWDNNGNQLQSITLAGTIPADIAIHPSTKQVFVTGYKQVTPDLKTPFLRGFDPNLNQIWNTWDYSATQVQSENLGADTEGKRITFGQNGGLYFLGQTDGGNNVFQRDGEDITQNLATKVDVDQFNNFAGASSGAFTFHAQINPSNGNIELGQFIVTQKTSGANSFTPNSITADESGNVYIGGASAFQLQNRDNRQINGQTVGSYTLGEMAILGLTPDYQVRKFWTPLTQTNDNDGSEGSIDGFAVRQGNAVIFSTVKQADVFTTSSAIQSSILGGTETYLATWNV